MDAARWQQIQDVFLDALELSPAERAPFLDGACGADAELRREVESLLDAGATADPLLDATLDDLVLLVEEDPARGPSAPERAGPYAVLEELGRGASVVGSGRLDQGHRPGQRSPVTGQDGDKERHDDPAKKNHIGTGRPDRSPERRRHRPGQ